MVLHKCLGLPLDSWTRQPAGLPRQKERVSCPRCERIPVRSASRPSAWCGRDPPPKAGPVSEPILWHCNRKDIEDIKSSIPLWSSPGGGKPGARSAPKLSRLERHQIWVEIGDERPMIGLGTSTGGKVTAALAGKFVRLPLAPLRIVLLECGHTSPRNSGRSQSTKTPGPPARIVPRPSRVDQRCA